MADKLIFPIGFDLEEGVKEVESQWKTTQKRLENTFKANTIQVDADISEKVLNNLYKKFEGLIKTMESKAPQIKLKIPDTVDFEQEINRLKVQLKSINLGELTDAESKDLYLYIRQLEALAKALKEVNKQEQLRQANNPENKALQEARAQEKLTRAKANDALAEQRRAKIATESARQAEINNRSAQRSAVIAEQKRAATARAEQAELRLANAKNRTTSATNAQNAAYATQSSYLSRLIQRIGVYFGLHQAFNFIRNIRDVTAEFELQRVALGSIIGDLNEANKMFEQIKAAAVKSPFQIKELVSYTKQLAAYKIEQDELFETTQRLADVSAGLGVSMERLVLAYGQIRATGYLRASEVRQLTEAGIPIVEELAKKMSQLRGETVSAAEVMGLISERAISFGMVKEVFDDMTSAGGMFYKMQEKQAETLAGQWSNLKDSVAIMYEEIGNTSVVSASMRGIISLLKSMTENWRVWGGIVEATLGTIGLYALAMKNASIASKALTVEEVKRNVVTSMQLNRAPKVIAAIIGENKARQLSIFFSKQLYRARIAEATATGVLTKALAKLRIAMLSNPYTAILAAIGAIIGAFLTFRKSAETTQEKIESLNASIASLSEHKDNVGKLVDELDALSQKSNKTAQEQERLNQVTQELADRYPSTISAVREYGKEVDITAGKVRELYEAEFKAKTVGLRAELAEDEKSLAKLQTQYNAIRAQQVKGTKRKVVSGMYGVSSTYEVALTDKEMAELNKKARELEEEINPLVRSIEDAKIALGDLPPRVTQNIEAFGVWKKTIKDFRTGLKNDLGEDIPLLDDEIIDQFKNLNEALDKVAEQYKNNDDAIKRYSKSLESRTLTKAEREDIERQIARATAFRDTASAILDYYNAHHLLDTKKSGGDQGESQLSILQKELQLHEKIYAKYKEYREYMSAEQAKARVEDYFGDTIDALMFKPSFKEGGYKQVLQQYKDYISTLPESEKVVLDLGFKIGDIDWQDEKDKIEKELSKLSQDLSRTKTAKEFFDRMIGLTGDRELSATLTMSVYGENADELGGKLAQQTIQGFKDKFKGVDFSEEAISDKGVFNWNKILAEGEKQRSKFGTDEYDKFLKDVDEGRKASAARVADLMNELKKTKTYGEKLVAIYTNTQERLNTIDQEVSDDAVRKRLKEQVKELQTKEIQKLQYDTFKDSPMYVAMFENLDATSTSMLTSMRSHILKLQSEWKNLDFTQLKELQSRINEIDKQLATRNPFKGIVDGIKEFNALQKSGSRKDDEQALLNAVVKRAEAQKKWEDAVTNGESEDKIKELAADLDKCVEAEKNATTQIAKWDDATQEVMQGMQNLQQITQLVQTTTTAVNDIVEAFGGWGDAADEEFWNTILDGVNGLMSGVQSAGMGVARIMAGDIIGGAASLISGIGSIVSSIGNLIYAGRIKRANKEIERQQKLLDNLAYSYERLGKAQEKAFGSDYISNYEQRMANLQAQQEAYLKQAQAERSKGKKSDKNKIKEYEEQARDTADEIKDMQSELSEYFLGTDLTSAARDFANAWIDAYKGFGSTTNAMKEKFQDMIQNMIVESFAVKVIQTALQPIFDSIDDMTKDGVLDTSDAAKIAEMTEVAVGNIDVGMTNLMNELSQAGISVRDMGSDLTGISKDIATASEESILGLAAGINTQNFYISQVPPKLDVIIGLLQGNNLTQGSAITLQDLVTLQNQHLSYLPSIAQHTADTVAECKQIVAETRRTADALERVIKPRGTQTTHTLNTTLN